MRDLYRRLGIAPGAAFHDIQEATAGTQDPNLKAAALEVLLQPERRRAYDRLHSALTDIGYLRAHLGATNIGFGMGNEYTDFRFKLTPSPPDASKPSVPPFRQPRSIGEINVPNRVAWSLGIILFIVLVAMSISESKKREPLQRPPPAQLASTVAQPAQSPTSLKVQPLPETGAGQTSGVSPALNYIEVKTRGDRHTLLKVEGHLTGEIVALQFIRAGESLKIGLQLGTYVLKTATGRQWYGDEHLFGVETTYSMPNDTFLLTQQGEYWEVELVPQQGGNLSERSISAADF